MHDWITHHKLPSLLILLDLEKAFDRVEHNFIWAVLRAIGLGGTFLRLVQGLLSQAVPKVHVNGYFTEEFKVARGVRQGCPLSPLIFALSTQPLMEMLQSKLSTGYLQGIKVNSSLSICHRLFTDDLGIFIPASEENFNKLQGLLRIYELASGAKINLSKTGIIFLAMNDIPQWLTDTGCKISKSGEIQKYLGAPIGYQLKLSTLHDFCLARISKRIKGWTNHLLSFTGKTILIQHVLQSIAIYHMMYIATPAGTIKQINRMLKDFLWGFNKEGGHRKTHLVSWKRLTQSRENGGLGFKDRGSHAQALLCKWVTKTLDDPDIEWAQLFLELTSRLTWENR